MSTDIFLSYSTFGKDFRLTMRDRRGHDRMVVGFTTSCAISAYHH